MHRWLRYLIALVVGSHGFIYLRLGLLGPSQPKGWHGSMLLGDAVTGDGLKTLLAVLYVSAGVVILACALAIAGARRVPGWWRPLAIGGALVGLAAFAVFLDGQARLAFEEGGIGAAVNLVLLAGAIAFGRALGGEKAPGTRNARMARPL